MRPTVPSIPKQSRRVGELLGRRLAELNRSAAELAEATHVPPKYIEDLIEGRRRPPLPGHTDVYEKMTTFLKLGRTELVACAQAERAESGNRPLRGPTPPVERLLLGLCEPGTAAKLRRRRGVTFAEFVLRLVQVTQGVVRRTLVDNLALRAGASRSGIPYVDMRLRILDFLDATPETLTAADVTEFIQPRIGLWDVDLETGVLRVVLRTTVPAERPGRRPSLKAWC